MENLEKHLQHYERKFFIERSCIPLEWKKRQNMTEHIIYIKTMSEHLQAVDDRISEKDLVIFLISSLPKKYNYFIETLKIIAEDHLTCDIIKNEKKVKRRNFAKLSNRMMLISYQNLTRSPLDVFTAKNVGIILAILIRRKRPGEKGKPGKTYKW